MLELHLGCDACLSLSPIDIRWHQPHLNSFIDSIFNAFSCSHHVMLQDEPVNALPWRKQAHLM